MKRCVATNADRGAAPHRLRAAYAVRRSNPEFAMRVPPPLQPHRGRPRCRFRIRRDSRTGQCVRARRGVQRQKRRANRAARRALYIGRVQQLPACRPLAVDDVARSAPRSVGIALAFHVDYWDRLGWKDRFASAAFTERQYDGMRANRARFVYTPQVVVQGRDFPDWQHPRGVSALAAAAESPRGRRSRSRRSGTWIDRGEDGGAHTDSCRSQGRRRLCRAGRRWTRVRRHGWGKCRQAARARQRRPAVSRGPSPDANGDMRYGK